MKTSLQQQRHGTPVKTASLILSFLCVMSFMSETLPAQDASSPSSTTPETKESDLDAVVKSVIEPKTESRPWKFIVVHHTAATHDTVESINKLHADKGWGGIGYHFLIGGGKNMKDGEIQPTYRWLEQRDGAHAGNREYNVHGIGVCLVGNFENTEPTDAQKKAVRALVRALQAKYNIENESLRRHGDVRATACPGKNFSMEIITKDDAP